MGSDELTVSLTHYEINDIAISFVDLARHRANTDYHITGNMRYNEMALKIIWMMSTLDKQTPTQKVVAINNLIRYAETLPTSMYIVKSLKQARAFVEVLDKIDETYNNQIYKVEF